MQRVSPKPQLLMAKRSRPCTRVQVSSEAVFVASVSISFIATNAALIIYQNLGQIKYLMSQRKIKK